MLTSCSPDEVRPGDVVLDDDGARWVVHTIWAVARLEDLGPRSTYYNLLVQAEGAPAWAAPGVTFGPYEHDAELTVDRVAVDQ